jgi:ABC-type dipeptide/oligopeptide/nickel transport system permease component
MGIPVGINGFGQLLVEAMRTSDVNVARNWMLIAGGAVIAVTEVERL